MKFIDEKDFKMREGQGEVVYDEKLDRYGLLVNGVFFSFLTKEQASMLDKTLADPNVEKYFNSIGIGEEFLNPQPKAACYTDYERPTGEIQFEGRNKIGRRLREASMRFSQEVHMSNKEFLKWEGAVLGKMPGVYESKYDDCNAIYIKGKRPKHIGTYNLKEEILYCDNIGLFGVVESKKKIKESDDYDEPAFNIYCVYSDEGGGERDGEPRYEEVEFDDLEDTIKSIRDSFLKGTLKGSYTWSPIDYTDESGDYCSMNAEQYANYEYKDECELNRLKIYCDPVRGTEDEYVVVIRGDGKIIKDTYGIDYVPEDDLTESKNR